MTDSIEELAQFWDTHDLTDFEDKLEEVKESVFERETLISIRLQPQEVERVKNTFFYFL
jgi:predicted DNA binding CopG/RHH family protein